MSTQHTPGPWSFSFESIDAEWAVVTAPGGLVVANANADSRQAANARLIAAAPELITELRNLRRAYVSLLEGGRDRILELGGDCDPVEVMEASNLYLRSANAVITKATGENHA